MHSAASRALTLWLKVVDRSCHALNDSEMPCFVSKNISVFAMVIRFRVLLCLNEFFIRANIS